MKYAISNLAKYWINNAYLFREYSRIHLSRTLIKITPLYKETKKVIWFFWQSCMKKFDVY